MNFFDYLLTTYGTDTPFYYNKIEFESYSKIWIEKKLSTLCAEEKLIHYSKGIYYIPSSSITNKDLGISTINPQKIYKEKYISDELNNYGFISGLSILNYFGVSQQVPNVIEIRTNNEATKKRTVIIGKQKIILRKSKVLINNENKNVLFILELVNYLDGYKLNSYSKKKIKNYINENKIQKMDLLNYAPYYSKKTINSLIFSGVLDYAA